MRFIGGWGAMGAGGAGVFTLPLTYPADPGAGGAITSLLAAGFVAIVVGVLELAFAWGAWNQADWGWLIGLGVTPPWPSCWPWAASSSGPPRPDRRSWACSSPWPSAPTSSCLAPAAPSDWGKEC